MGVAGNERADTAAKAATCLTHVAHIPIPYDDFKCSIRKFSRKIWQEHWTNLSGNLKLKSIRPSVLPWKTEFMDRRSSIVLTRLRIGHTYSTHRYLLASGAERQVPQCPPCNVDFTVRHILVECPMFENERRANHLLNKSLRDILGESSPVEQVLKFLKDINIFFDI